MTTVHATEPNYELHSLGWKAFQDLIATILSEVMGQTFEQFVPTHDGGRDGAFFGSWNNAVEGSIKGSFTIQCKHTSTLGKMLYVSDLGDELYKARRLAAKGLAENYLLFTNYGVTGVAEESIRSAILAVPGIKWFGLYGSTWINARIRETPRLRMLVPRVYGLGDLSQILDERTYEQARVILDSLGPELGKFVTTGAHNKAANAILRHGFVILLGEPASGKTMIAATIALGAIDVWNCQTMKLTDPRDFAKHWNPHEPRQFLWFDDAFGATQYQRELALYWNRVFPHLAAAISAGARIIITSRDYIFKAALADIKISAFPLLKESQVIVDVQELNPSEKQQIVYNHIKLGDQTKSYKTQIKTFLPQISESQCFLPEIARRLGTQLFTKNLLCDSEHVKAFVEQPVDYLTDILSSLDVHSKAAIGLLFMNGGSLSHPLSLTPRELKALALLGSSEKEVRQILYTLDGNLLRLVPSAPSRWTYKHPTIGDAYARILVSNPELIDVYLKGVKPEKLVHEITCGDTGLKNAIVIPSSRYASIQDAIDRMRNDDSLYMFLAYRCDAEFLHMYLTQHPKLMDSLMNFNSYMGVTREVSVIGRLYECNLLAEMARRQFVARARTLALETPDPDWIVYEHIRRIFRNEEIASILEEIRISLLSSIDEKIQDWRWNYDKTEDPESYFKPLKDTLSVYREHLADFESDSIISKALKRIESAVEDMTYEREYPYYDDEEYHSSRSSAAGKEARSIFDDVDE